MASLITIPHLVTWMLSCVQQWLATGLLPHLWTSRHPYETPRFGTFTSTAGILELEWAGYLLEEGGREGLEQDRTILLGMSTHKKNDSLSGTQRINRGD